MTRIGPRKKVDSNYWQGRLAQARAYLEAARQAARLAQAGANANPIISQIVLSAIAFGDCLTARRAQVVNQQDHAAAAKLLHDVLHDQLPEEQHKRYRRILAAKDAAQYGARTAPLEYANRLFRELEAFARWAEDQL